MKNQNNKPTPEAQTEDVIIPFSLAMRVAMFISLIATVLVTILAHNRGFSAAFAVPFAVFIGAGFLAVVARHGYNRRAEMPGDTLKLLYWHLARLALLDNVLVSAVTYWM